MLTGPVSAHVNGTQLAVITTSDLLRQVEDGLCRFTKLCQAGRESSSSLELIDRMSELCYRSGTVDSCRIVCNDNEINASSFSEVVSRMH